MAPEQMPVNASKQRDILLDSALKGCSISARAPLQDPSPFQLSKSRQGERVMVGGEESKILGPGLLGRTLKDRRVRTGDMTAESKAEVLR